MARSGSDTSPATVVRNIAVVGLGTVGTALVELLVERGEQVRAERGIDLRVTGVTTRRLGMVAEPAGLDLHDLAVGRLPDGDPYDLDALDGWLDRTAADVLVELTP